MKTRSLRKGISLISTLAILFAISAVPASAVAIPENEKTAQKLISEANLSEKISTQEVSDDLTFLSDKGFDSKGISICNIDNQGDRLYECQNSDGNPVEVMVVENENGLRSGFYHTIDTTPPPGTSFGQYTGYRSFYNSTGMQTFTGILLSVSTATLGGWIVGAYSSGLLMTKAVAKEIAAGLQGCAVSVVVNATGASFVDYKVAHPQNSTGLEKYFRHDITFTTNLGGTWTEYSYEVLTPI